MYFMVIGVNLMYIWEKKMNTVKEWLLRATTIDTEISALESELNSVSGRVYIGIKYGDKVQAERSNSIEDAVNTYMKYSNKLLEKLQELYAVKTEIALVIFKVASERYRTLLELRYLKMLTWEKVAEKMNIDVRHIYRIHEEALKEVNEMVEKGIKV